MKFSLIMATLGRDKEIEIFIESLLKQTYKNYELIIVDQNIDNKVQKIYEKYREKLEIKYVKSLIKGLSYNRNIGLDLAKGKIIGFPDDDCEYNDNTLEKIHKFFFEEKVFNIYSCGVEDKITGKKFDFFKKSQHITKKNLMKVGCSITFFIKKKTNFSTRFDNDLGVGAKFGSGEETDFISSLLSLNYKGYYFSNDYIYHEVKPVSLTVQRYYSYGLGYGALSKKEIILRKNFSFIIELTKQLLKGIIGSILINKKNKYYFFYLKGIIEGLFCYKIKNK
ncbi:glycosyltransferase family 2 protein [Cetobacterium sp.]|uniref:glycosyltransferase family 2 protein n=1 Tax=Cetobacterium sp. TaxID=2071632 RepID=UPI003EE6B686